MLSQRCGLGRMRSGEGEMSNVVGIESVGGEMLNTYGRPLRGIAFIW